MFTHHSHYDYIINFKKRFKKVNFLNLMIIAYSHSRLNQFIRFLRMNSVPNSVILQGKDSNYVRQVRATYLRACARRMRDVVHAPTHTCAGGESSVS